MTRYDGPVPIRPPTYTTFAYVGLAVVVVVLLIWGAIIAAPF
jgi:hypothetical protein